MKSKCKSGHFVAYHSIMHKADCLFDDSEYLENEINNGLKNARGGYENYYMPLLLMYICAIESFANTMGFFLIEDFEQKFERSPICKKLKLCYRKLELEYQQNQGDLNTLKEAIKIRNRWTHCKHIKEVFITDWESNSFEDCHNVRSELEEITNKNVIVKIKDAVHQIIKFVTDKALTNFPDSKELRELLFGVSPTVYTDIGVKIPIKTKTLEKSHDTSK